MSSYVLALARDTQDVAFKMIGENQDNDFGTKHTLQNTFLCSADRGTY